MLAIEAAVEDLDMTVTDGQQAAVRLDEWEGWDAREISLALVDRLDQAGYEIVKKRN